MKITKYEEAFDLINIKFTDKTKEKLQALEKEGYKEKNICFAIWKAQEKLIGFRDDSRFWSIFYNEVRKISFKSKI